MVAKLTIFSIAAAIILPLIVAAYIFWITRDRPEDDYEPYD